MGLGWRPWADGNPDNLALDQQGNLWIVTDRSMKSAAGMFSATTAAGGAAGWGSLCFAIGPMECALTGVCLDQEESSLFLAVQHPGEVHGARVSGGIEFQSHQLVDREGSSFQQLRQVPLGSNWPAQAPGRPPRPGVVAIHRGRGQPLLLG